MTEPNLNSSQSFSPQRLQREVGVFHRNVVLKFLDLQDRMTLSLQVVHVDLVGCPDALIIPDIGVMRPPDQFFSAVVFDLNEGVIVLSHPQVRITVLRDFGLFWRRLQLPAGGAVERFFAEQLVIELICVAFFEIFETEIRPEKPR